MELKFNVVDLKWEEECNIIVGQSHFIKTVEDLAEIMASHVPGAEFGLAFSEASGPCLIRTEGNSETLVKQATTCAEEVGAGHTFFLIIKNAWPIAILNPIKNCQEVTRVYAATANPLQVVVGETDMGRGIMGVIDGFSPVGVEGPEEKKDRHNILRTFNYKF